MIRFFDKQKYRLKQQSPYRKIYGLVEII